MNRRISIESFKRSYFVTFVWRIALLYILMATLRCVMFLFNRDLIGEISFSELTTLLHGTLLFDTASILYTNFLWITLSLLPVPFRTRKWYQESLFWLYIVSNGVAITALNFCDTVFFHYGQKRISGDDMIFAQNSNNQDLALTFAIDYWWMFPLGVAFMVLLGYAYRRRATLRDWPRRPRYFYPIFAAITLGFIYLSSAMLLRSVAPKSTSKIEVSNTAKYTSEKNKAQVILSNPFCFIKTLERRVESVPTYFNKGRLYNLFSPYHYPTTEQIQSASHKGYNVMIFILESFSAENSAHLSPQLYTEGNVGYMPFLDSLMREGVTLENNYANGYQSICSTPAILGSIPSLEVPFISYAESAGRSYQMPSMLKDMGYSTAFFCGSERTSMGFEAYTKSAGVDRYFAKEDYEARHGYNDFDETWGIWDVPFCEYVGEEISTLKEPFFAAQFTVTSHHPFPIHKDYKNRLPIGRTRIQPVTAYTDLALRNFFEKNRDKEWFKRTIFLFVGDHVSSEKMAEESRRYPGNCHIVGALYTADGSLRGSIKEVTQQIDIMPTLLTLLGNEKPYFAFGRDIFDPNDPRPRWSVTFSGTTAAIDSNQGVVRVEDNDLLKAFEQQYFEHLSRSLFVVPDRSR